MHRWPVYIYLLNVPSFSSRYFNKIKRTSRLGRLLALSLEILFHTLATFNVQIQVARKVFLQYQYSGEFSIKLEYHRKLISAKRVKNRISSSYCHPTNECRDKPHNITETATFHAWVKMKRCIDNHFTFNQKGDNLLQDQFKTRILNQNLYKLPICVDFRSV